MVSDFMHTDKKGVRKTRNERCHKSIVGDAPHFIVWLFYSVPHSCVGHAGLFPYC